MKRVQVGRLGSAYGLGGAVKFRGEPLVAGLERVYIEGIGYRAVEEAYYLGEELVLELAGVGTVEAARALAGRAVLADPEELPELEEGQFYYFQLIGLPVLVNGEPVGEVVDVDDAGAQDVLVVQAGTKRHLIPLQAPYVKASASRIEVEPIPGLLD
ncbi:Ribosome maturation factor RimM [Calidithermus terrae]|uniref:Ribosome maturation factor RimM n=1 Tax=Calidithermus terrae TaxID=1408545 RepID=A0A399EP61_9DEIN|nr:ribosome maturation factor RimM [Calidithermus terrae]RIH85768.1 Ribosome maturation factor RimM [Calidithermus terrae]